MIGHDVLTTRDHLTPHTSPPHPEPVNPCSGAIAIQSGPGNNVLQTIQELARINGGLPEDAIDDESSYAPSFMLARATSIDNGDHSHRFGSTTMAAVELNGDNVERDHLGHNVEDDHMGYSVEDDHAGHNGPQRPQELPLCQTAPTQVERLGGDVPRDFRLQTLKNDESSSSSGTSQSSCRSATLMAMAHNCVTHAGHSGGSDCPRNSPMRTAQSGTDPFPDGPTKQRFRTERTVLNANMRQRSYMTNQELRDVLDDRNFRNKQVSRGAPVELQYVGDAYRVQGSERNVTCPPGFEAHEAAGLLPFQQASAQKATDRTTI